MQIIRFALVFGLLGYTISKPLDSNDASDALVENWQSSTLQSWPLQPVPLTAYTTNGLNLLTPGQLQHNNEVKQKLQLSTPSLQRSTNFVHFFAPQYLANPQQYLAFNNAFFNAPFSQLAYTPGQHYLPQLIPTIHTIPHKMPTNGEKAITSATKRPNIKDREPTTRKPQGTLQVNPPKLQFKPEKITQEVADFKNDVALLKAVEKINPEYVIEEIINVPGKLILSTKATEEIKSQQTLGKPITKLAPEPNQKQIRLVSKSAVQRASKPPSSAIKVEATGKTSTKGNVPEIPFGSYFLPYFSQNQIQQQQTGKKAAALILEPHSKAIVGNGGTAISTPISKAYLKRGVTTNVYFNPESVAIAGVGGKAHAQADLELDLIN